MNNDINGNFLFSEPEFVTFRGAQESIPSLACRYDNPNWRTGLPGYITVLGIRDILVLDLPPPHPPPSSPLPPPPPLPPSPFLSSFITAISFFSFYLHISWIRIRIRIRIQPRIRLLSSLILRMQINICFAFFLITCQQKHHLQSKKSNFVLKFCVTILFCRHYFSPLNSSVRKGKDPEPDPDQEPDPIHTSVNWIRIRIRDAQNMRILPHCHIGWRNRYLESLTVYKASGISFVQDQDPILLRGEK